MAFNPNCFYSVKLVKHEPTVVGAFDNLTEAQADVDARVANVKNPAKSPIKYRAGELGSYRDKPFVWVSKPQDAMAAYEQQDFFKAQPSIIWGVHSHAIKTDDIKVDIQPDNPDLPRIQSDTFSYDLVKDVNHELDFNLDGLGDDKGLQQ